jgi:hypothetical protein
MSTQQLSSPESFVTLRTVGVATAVSLLCGLAWGGIAYLTNSVYLTIALVIGFAIYYTLSKPLAAVPLPHALRLLPIALLLAALAIVVGDALYYILLITAEGTATFGRAILLVLPTVAEIAWQDSFTPVLLAMLGSGIAFISALNRG